jgi:dipeptidyl aminopeptidase/acylaminoacyl peptidase
MRRTDARDGESKRLTRFWDRTLGTDMEALARVSPVTRVGEIKVPVMLVHGRADTTASFNQYKAMEAALRSTGTPAETFVVDAEGHGFVKPENISELYRRMEQFLDKHIGPSAAPVSATQ